MNITDTQSMPNGHTLCIRDLDWIHIVYSGPIHSQYNQCNPHIPKYRHHTPNTTKRAHTCISRYGSRMVFSGDVFRFRGLCFSFSGGVKTVNDKTPLNVMKLYSTSPCPLILTADHAMYMQYILKCLSKLDHVCPI